MIATTATRCYFCGTRHIDAYGRPGYCPDCGDFTDTRATARVCAFCGGPHSRRDGHRRYCRYCGDFTPSTRYAPRKH